LLFSIQSEAIIHLDRLTLSIGIMRLTSEAP
jgi:hypothetical protein